MELARNLPRRIGQGRRQHQRPRLRHRVLLERLARAQEGVERGSWVHQRRENGHGRPIHLAHQREVSERNTASEL